MAALTKENFPSRFYPRGNWLDIMKELKDHVSYCGREDNADYAVLHECGTTTLFTSQPCHGDLRNLKLDYSWSTKSKPMYVVTWIHGDVAGGGYYESSYTKENFGHVDVYPFYNWLIKDSLFSEYIVNNTFEDALDRGMIVRATMPANLLSMLMTLSRRLWEYTYSIDLWNKMVDAGVDKMMALVCSNLVQPVYFNEEVKGYRLLAEENGHIPFSMGWMNREFFDNILSSTVKNPNKIYMEQQQWRGVYWLWSGEEREEVYEQVLPDAIDVAKFFPSDIKAEVGTRWDGSPLYSSLISDANIIKGALALQEEVMQCVSS